VEFRVADSTVGDPLVLDVMNRPLNDSMAEEPTSSSTMRLGHLSAQE
jgi:hypothetical protein